MMLGLTVLDAVTLLSLHLFALALLFAIFRLLLGPTLADRVVALDLIAALVVGVIAAWSVHTGEPLLLRTGIVVALVAFLGTVAFAMFLEKRGPE